MFWINQCFLCFVPICSKEEISWYINCFRLNFFYFGDFLLLFGGKKNTLKVTQKFIFMMADTSGGYERCLHSFPFFGQHFRERGFGFLCCSLSSCKKNRPASLLPSSTKLSPRAHLRGTSFISSSEKQGVRVGESWSKEAFVDGKIQTAVCIPERAALWCILQLGPRKIRLLFSAPVPPWWGCL